MPFIYYIYASTSVQPQVGRKQCSVTQAQALKCPGWSKDGSREDAKEKENYSTCDCNGEMQAQRGNTSAGTVREGGMAVDVHQIPLAEL